MNYYSIDYHGNDLYETKIIKNNNSEYYWAPHWHNSLELILCCEGSLYVKINTKFHYLKANDIVVINSSQIHSLKSSSKFKILTLVINNDALLDYKNIFRSFYFSTRKNDQNWPYLLKLRQYMEELNLIKNKKYEGIEFKIQACISDLIFILLTQFKIKDGTLQNIKQSQKYQLVVSKILVYIEENYRSSLNLATVAEHFSYSPTYFSKFFKKHVNISFYEYLSKIRLKHAYFDLIKTDLPLNKIAAKNGFASTRAFSSYFSKTYGALPTRYRKQHRQNNA